MLYNRKDVVREQGIAFFVGFVIAGGICALFFLVLGVNAATFDTFIAGQDAPNKIYAPLTTIQPDTKTLQTENDNLKLLVSKYAKLYDSCKNK